MWKIVQPASYPQVFGNTNRVVTEKENKKKGNAAKDFGRSAAPLGSTITNVEEALSG